MYPTNGQQNYDAVATFREGRKEGVAVGVGTTLLVIVLSATVRSIVTEKFALKFSKKDTEQVQEES